VAGVLEAARSDARRRLAATRTARGQASAADSIAHAYSVGAARLAPLAGRDEQAPAAMLRAFRQAAAAYDALSSAARVGDARRFSASREQIARAEVKVRRTLHQLSTRPA